MIRTRLILALVVCTWAASQALADDWVVRTVHIREEATPANADILLSSAGDVRVGYALGFSGLPVEVATLNGRLFEYDTFDEPAGGSATFAMDAFGGAYYATGGTQTHYGQDLGVWGGKQTVDLLSLRFSTHPFSCPAIALDNHGVPAMLGLTSTGGATYARFDIPSGQWVTEAIGAAAPGFGSFGSLCFDAQDRPVIGYLLPSGMTISIRTDSGWQALYTAMDRAGSTVPTVAIGLGGEVAFAYHGTSGLVFGEVRDGVVSTATIDVNSARGGYLLPNSLAYDPDGNPAIVYRTELDDNLRLFRRDADGNWTQELLPTSSLWGSVAFDGTGNPYVASSGLDTVYLMGPTVPELKLGDFNGDDDVNAADIDLLRTAINEGAGWFYDLNLDGRTDPRDMEYMVRDVLNTSYGDHDLDGIVGLPDLFAVRNNFQQLGGWGQGNFGLDDEVDLDDLFIVRNNFGAGEAGPVPEPSAALLLAASAGLLLRRRRARGR